MRPREADPANPMSLRLRLFLLVAGLLSLVLVAQALLVRSLATRLTENVRTVAVRVGNEILSGFELRTGDDEAGPAAGHETRVLVLAGPPAGVSSRRGESEGVAEAPPVERSGPSEKGKLRWVVHQETAWGHTNGEGRGPGLGETPQGKDRLEVGAQARSGEPGSETIVTERRHDGSTVTREIHRMVVDSPPEANMLFVRGPQLERAIPIPHAEVSSTLEAFGTRLLIGSLAILALGLLATVWVTRRLTRPLAELAKAARRVGEGELGVEVAIRRQDEVGQVIASFNRMSERLVELDSENRRLQDRRQLGELGDVARGLAHSLRNPLNALGLSLEELGARALPESDPAPLVETARRQIQRIDAALRSFLALASSSRGGENGEVDLAALAREVALEALQDARGRVRVVVEVAEPVPALRALAAELRAVVQALVVNAVDASPDGAVVTVRLSAAAEAGRVLVEVLDDGSGVAEEIRPRLFTPHLTTKPHGAGMGLYLAHRVATGRYRGSLTLEPREGGGTRARLELGEREEASDG